MKTLVTGANGFIGSAVVRKLLGRGREVRAFVEPRASLRNLEGLDIEVVEGDIRDRQAVRAAMQGTDVLYHLAAIYKLWLPRSRLIYEVNVEGTKNVLFAAMHAGLRKVVHTSSIATIGLPEPGGLADETSEFDDWELASEYIHSKWLSERDAMRFAAEGVPVVVVNPAFPFGERDLAPTPTGRFITQALQGRVPGYPGGGFNVIDVEDAAEGHVLAEERGVVGERYILGNYNLTYKDFYNEVTELAGLPRIRRKLPDAIILATAWAMERYAGYTREPPLATVKAARYASRRVWFDTTKARTRLALPRTPLRHTIERAIRWFRANGYG